MDNKIKKLAYTFMRVQVEKEMDSMGYYDDFVDDENSRKMFRQVYDFLDDIKDKHNL
jgi:hypothetical protein|tara:strand:- start:174 stop:344 length:171 start_codon:yes stop_codon:yes gene_type:complete